MVRTGFAFPPVHSTGGLLPPDLPRRTVEADAELKGFEPTDHGLGARDPVRGAIGRAWQHARASGRPSAPARSRSSTAHRP